ncbi:hypothetical protein FBU30_006634, partial [Linnemannia zychae]
LSTSLLSLKNIFSAMSLFKSNKNKTTSAATTPAQTPRTSLNEQRQTSTQMTQEQAIRMAMKKSIQTPVYIHNLL